MANSRICSVAGCGNKVFCRDWCSMHYSRWQRHGNPLFIEKPSEIYQKYIDEIIIPYTRNECLIWPFGKNNNGYGCISGENGKSLFVHRLICEIENGPLPTPKHQACHSCGNGKNGCVTRHHLYWGTAQENQNDRIKHGTDENGSKSPNAKLSELDALLIKYSNDTHINIAKRFNVSRTTVTLIKTGKTWKHLL